MSKLQTTVHVGLVGCGNLGRIHGDCLTRVAGAKVLACCDLVESLAMQLCEKTGAEYATTDVEKVLSDKRIDAVYISTRHDVHASLAIAAAEAGKHILIEKPLALSIDECRAVERAVNAAGVHLMPAFKMRYFPLIQMAREFIPQPQVQFGQIIKRRWADDRWDMPVKQGGGNVLGQGCHGIDLIRYLSGSEATHIYAVGGTHTHPSHPYPDQCMASVRFANGHGANWIQGDAGSASFTSDFFWEMFADDRSVQLHARLNKATFNDRGKIWTEERPEEEGFYFENVDFITALRDGRAPQTTLWDGIQATRIPLAAIESIRTNTIQPVGPDTW